MVVKYRHPDSFEHALVAIAHRIGWAAVATIASRTDRTVRDWSDPDSPRTPPIATAAALDRAWHDAGGIGSPLSDALGRKVARPPVWIGYDAARLGDATVLCIREGSEAKAALVQAILPGSTAAHRREAAQQIAEGIAAFHATLPLLAVTVPPHPPP